MNRNVRLSYIPYDVLRSAQIPTVSQLDTALKVPEVTDFRDIEAAILPLHKSPCEKAKHSPQHRGTHTLKTG